MSAKRRPARFILTVLAREDVLDIQRYLAAENVEASGRVGDALEAAFERLAGTPGLGHFREDLADRRHKFFLVFRYLVIYRWESRPLEIVRVLHASRDVEGLLGLGDAEK